MKKGRTASELEHPQTWDEGSDASSNQGNTSGALGITRENRSRNLFPGSESGQETGGEKTGRALGASETMDKLFPLGTPTPEKDELSNEIRKWIHDLGGESHQRLNAVERLSEIGPPAIPYLLLALKDTYPFTRVGALSALANIRDKAAIPAFESLLRDQEYVVRAEAAKSLGTIKSKDSILKLAACLEDQEPHVRREAVIALGKLKIANARDALISALQTTLHADVRQQAVQELSAFPGPEAVEALLQCTRGRDIKLYVFAIRALGEIGDPAARRRLTELSHHHDRAVREAAAAALQELE